MSINTLLIASHCFRIPGLHIRMDTSHCCRTALLKSLRLVSGSYGQSASVLAGFLSTEPAELEIMNLFVHVCSCLFILFISKCHSHWLWRQECESICRQARILTSSQEKDMEKTWRNWTQGVAGRRRASPGGKKSFPLQALQKRRLNEAAVTAITAKRLDGHFQVSSHGQW